MIAMRFRYDYEAAFFKILSGKTDMNFQPLGSLRVEELVVAIDSVLRNNSAC